MSDTNALTNTPSVEGYSSLVDTTYAPITGSHPALGEGQDVLNPATISDGTLDQLDTTVLLAPSAYLVTTVTESAASSAGAQSGGAQSAGAQSAGAHTGRRDVAARGVPPRGTSGRPLDVTSFTIPMTTDPGGVGPGVHVGLVRPAGSTDWTVPVRVADGAISITLATSAEVVGVRVSAGTAALGLGPPVVQTEQGVVVPGRRSGSKSALIPPRTGPLHGSDGAFAVFGDARASPPLTLQAGPGGSSDGASVRAASGPRFAPTRSAAVSSPRAVTVVRGRGRHPGVDRAVAATAGRGRPAGTTRFRTRRPRAGGHRPRRSAGVVSWRYDPPGLALGVWVSGRSARPERRDGTRVVRVVATLEARLSRASVRGGPDRRRAVPAVDGS